jgi:hypothetical protein
MTLLKARTYINDAIANCILRGSKDEHIVFFLDLVCTYKSNSHTLLAKKLLFAGNTSEKQVPNSVKVHFQLHVFLGPQHDFKCSHPQYYETFQYQE